MSQAFLVSSRVGSAGLIGPARGQVPVSVSDFGDTLGAVQAASALDAPGKTPAGPGAGANGAGGNAESSKAAGAAAGTSFTRAPDALAGARAGDLVAVSASPGQGARVATTGLPPTGTAAAPTRRATADLADRAASPAASFSAGIAGAPSRPRPAPLPIKGGPPSANVALPPVTATAAAPASQSLSAVPTAAVTVSAGAAHRAARTTPKPAIAADLGSAAGPRAVVPPAGDAPATVTAVDVAFAGALSGQTPRRPNSAIPEGGDAGAVSSVTAGIAGSGDGASVAPARPIAASAPSVAAPTVAPPSAGAVSSAIKRAGFSAASGVMAIGAAGTPPASAAGVTDAVPAIGPGRQDGATTTSVLAGGNGISDAPASVVVPMPAASGSAAVPGAALPGVPSDAMAAAARMNGSWRASAQPTGATMQPTVAENGPAATTPGHVAVAPAPSAGAISQGPPAHGVSGRADTPPSGAASGAGGIPAPGDAQVRGDGAPPHGTVAPVGLAAPDLAVQPPVAAGDNPGAVPAVGQIDGSQTVGTNAGQLAVAGLVDVGVSQATGQVGTPAAAATAATPAAGANPPTPPAQQIAPLVLALAGNRATAKNSLSVTLAPEKLGSVSITVDRMKDGPTMIHVTAERMETFHLLQKDQADLAQALNQAGVPADGRTLSFAWTGGEGGRSAWAGQGEGRGQGENRGHYAPNAYNEDNAATPTPGRRRATAASGSVDITA